MQAVDLKVTDGAAAGSRIEPGLRGQFGAVSLQVPQGFETYARILHLLEGPLSAVDQITEEPKPGPHNLFMAFTKEGSEPPSEEEIARSLKRRSAPNLIWPADHSWLVASEVDLEAWEVEPAASLADDADKINVTPEAG